MAREEPVFFGTPLRFKLDPRDHQMFLCRFAVLGGSGLGGRVFKEMMERYYEKKKSF